MAKTRKGSVVKKGLKFFTWGKQGTGKSPFALSAAKLKREDGKPMRVGYIDTEGGSADMYLETLQEEGIDIDNILFVYTNSYTEVNEWVNKFISEEELYHTDDDGDETDELILDADGEPFVADFIVLDGVSVVQDTLKYSKILTSEKRAKLRAKSKENATATSIFVAEATAGMEFKDHDKLQQQGKHLLHNLVHKTNKYVCVTARLKDDKEMKRGSDGSFTSVKVGEIPDAFKGAEYEFFTVIKTFKEDEEDDTYYGRIMRKDRTLTYKPGTVLEKPQMSLWQDVILKNKDKAEATVNSDYSKAVENDTDKVKSESILYKKLIGEHKKLTTEQRKELNSKLIEQKLPTKPNVSMDDEVLNSILKIISTIK